MKDKQNDSKMYYTFSFRKSPHINQVFTIGYHIKT